MHSVQSARKKTLIIIIGSIGAISKSFGQHLSNIPGKHEANTTKHTVIREITLHVAQIVITE